MTTRFQQKVIIGQYHDALMHRHVQRSLPRVGCTAAESGRGPDRWWSDGDVWIGLFCWCVGIWACVQVIREALA